MTRDYAARRGRGFPNPYDLSLADNVYQVMKKREQKIPISEKIFSPQVFNCDGSRYTDGGSGGVEGTKYPVRRGSRL